MSASGTPPAARPLAAPDVPARPVSLATTHRTIWWYVAAAAAMLVAAELASLLAQPRRALSQRSDEGAAVPAASAIPPTPATVKHMPSTQAAVPSSHSPASAGAYLVSAPAPPPWTWTARQRVAAAAQAGAALLLIGIALAPQVLEAAERNVRVHHFEHAALLGGGGLLGLVLGWIMRPPGHHMDWERYLKWRQIALGVVLLGPLVVMAVMIPSTSAWIDAHPLAHVLEHLGLIALGGMIGLSGRLYSTALGWLVVVLVAAMAAAFGAMALAQPLGLVGISVTLPPV